MQVKARNLSNPPCKQNLNQGFVPPQIHIRLDQEKDTVLMVGSSDQSQDEVDQNISLITINKPSTDSSQNSALTPREIEHELVISSGTGSEMGKLRNYVTASANLNPVTRSFN